MTTTIARPSRASVRVMRFPKPCMRRWRAGGMWTEVAEVGICIASGSTYDSSWTNLGPGKQLACMYKNILEWNACAHVTFSKYVESNAAIFGEIQNRADRADAVRPDSTWTRKSKANSWVVRVIPSPWVAATEYWLCIVPGRYTQSLVS